MGPNEVIGGVTSATKPALGPMPTLHELRLRTTHDLYLATGLPAHQQYKMTRTRDMRGPQL